VVPTSEGLGHSGLAVAWVWEWLGWWFFRGAQALEVHSSCGIQLKDSGHHPLWMLVPWTVFALAAGVSSGVSPVPGAIGV